MLYGILSFRHHEALELLIVFCHDLVLKSYNAVLDCEMDFCNDGLKCATVWKYFCALHCPGLLGKL